LTLLNEGISPSLFPPLQALLALETNKAPLPCPTFKTFVKIVSPTPNEEPASEPQFPKWNQGGFIS